MPGDFSPANIIVDNDFKVSYIDISAMSRNHYQDPTLSIYSLFQQLISDYFINKLPISVKDLEIRPLPEVISIALKGFKEGFLYDANGIVKSKFNQMLNNLADNNPAYKEEILKALY